MAISKTSERQPRFRRVKARPFRLQERDNDIVRAVYKHRFLSSEHINALVEGSDQGVLRRLNLLFHAGYLDRPREQIRPYQAGNRAMIYGLGNKGADLLLEKFNVPREKVDWTSKNREVKTVFLEHALKISNFMVCLEVACRNSKKVELMGPEEILRQMPQAKGPNPFSWAIVKRFGDDRTGEKRDYKFSIIPDHVFGLYFPEDPPDRNKAFFFLECDRSTMPIYRRNFFKTSFAKKIALYWDSWQQGLYGKHFGFNHARVLTLAKSPARIKSMIEAVKNADPRKKGYRMFYFCEDSFISLREPERLLEKVWTDGRGEEASLLD